MTRRAFRDHAALRFAEIFLQALVDAKVPDRQHVLMAEAAYEMADALTEARDRRDYPDLAAQTATGEEVKPA